MMNDPSPRFDAEGRYRYIGELGRGGMGTVYEVFDTRLERNVALKVLNEGSVCQSGAADRFLQEARAVSRLEHPNVIPIYDMGTTPAGDLFFTMKVVRGLSLDRVIRQLATGDPQAHQRYCFTTRLDISLQIARAVGYAHQHGVLHRDLKPENVMLGEFGEVLVMDWGLAGAVDCASDECVGTPGYMAPETLLGSPYTVQADVYGLGALMYALFSLHSPFDGHTPGEVLGLSTIQDPTPVEEAFWPAQGSIPAEICWVITLAMARETSERYATMDVMAAEIVACLGQTMPVRCVYTGFKRMLHSLAWMADNRPKTLVAAGVALASVVPLGTVAVWLFHH